MTLVSQMVQMVKDLSVKKILKGDLDSIPGSGRSPGGGSGNSVQYSCLENGQRSLVGYSPWGPIETDYVCSHREKHFHLSPQFKKERR